MTANPFWDLWRFLSHFEYFLAFLRLLDYLNSIVGDSIVTIGSRTRYSKTCMHISGQFCDLSFCDAIEGAFMTYDEIFPTMSGIFSHRTCIPRLLFQKLPPFSDLEFYNFNNNKVWIRQLNVRIKFPDHLRDNKRVPSRETSTCSPGLRKFKR